MQVGYALDPGKRTRQEDYVGGRQLDDGALLVVLADGLGGHSGGDIASKQAVSCFCEAFPQTTGSIPQRLQASLQTTQQHLCALAQTDKSLEPMGTTLVAVWVKDRAFYWLSVGDSLLYHLHRWQLSKCNATHNLQERFKRLLETGSISTAEYEAIEEPLALTSALGPHKLHEIDCQKGQLEPGDRLLVASDGLLTLPRAAIQTQLSEPASAQSVADHLLQATLNLKHATQDNISLIVISPSAAVTAGTQVDTLPTSWWTRWLSLLLAIFLMSIVAGLYGLFIVNESAHVPTEPQSSLKPSANRLIGITQATQPLQTNLPPQPSTPVKESKDGTRQIPELLIWPKPSSSALNH